MESQRGISGLSGMFLENMKKSRFKLLNTLAPLLGALDKHFPSAIFFHHSFLNRQWLNARLCCCNWITYKIYVNPNKLVDVIWPLARATKIHRIVFLIHFLDYVMKITTLYWLWHQNIALVMECILFHTFKGKLVVSRII